MEKLQTVEKEKTPYLFYLAIFTAGGLVYGAIEILFRGYTHWSMVLTGGACVLTFWFFEEEMGEERGNVGNLGAGAANTDNVNLNFENSKGTLLRKLLLKGLVGMLIITFYEFFVGCIVNLRFGLGVWDYSDRPLSLFGQICPLFSFFWFFLSLCLAGLLQVWYNRSGRHRF